SGFAASTSRRWPTPDPDLPQKHETRPWGPGPATTLRQESEYAMSIPYQQDHATLLPPADAARSNLRRAATSLRLAEQLLDAGALTWSAAYAWAAADAAERAQALLAAAAPHLAVAR